MKKILLALILALPMMAMAVEKPWKNGKLKISENRELSLIGWSDLADEISPNESKVILELI